MPYKSGAQSRYIHMKAGQGVGWAEKFVRDAQHGEGSVRSLPKHVKHKIGKPKRRA